MAPLRLIEAMKKPNFYPHHPPAVEFLQTHISYLFLAGDYVYKVKKPVRFDFLDFTSLKKRKFFCEEELTLNRRLAPHAYLDVVPIYSDAQGNFTLNPLGKIVEYAVWMKRLPHDKMLKTLLARGAVDEKLMDLIAKKIARFHQEARTDAAIEKMGSVETIRRNHQENFRETKRYLSLTLSPPSYDFIKDYVSKFLSEKTALFEKRVAEHKIRDGHGDLHLDHICLDDDISIFDCIEFNERFRYGDVAEDVAFLTMDMDFNGYSGHAKRFVESYVHYSGDTDLPRLLNFYCCYYAFVRGKVASFRLTQKGISLAERQSLKKTAKRYFDLAYTYAARLEKPILMIMTGLMGSGKSHQAMKLAQRLDADVIRSDLLRKELFHLKATEKNYEDFGTGIYSAENTCLVYDRALALAEQKIRQGKAVIIDASFKKRFQREKARELARQLRVRFFIVECVCPEDLIRERLEKRVLDKTNPSDGRWELFEKQKADFDALTEERPDDGILHIDTSRYPENALHEIIRKIKLEES